MIKIPITELVDIKKLKVDGKNPNQLSKDKRTALKKNMEKYGFIVPVITNKDYLIADGQNRQEIGLELGMTKVPVIKLDVEEVDRRILRQVLNKLRGEHKPDLDMEEYQFILKETSMEEFTNLLGSSEQGILNTLNKIETSEIGENVDKIARLLITCPKCNHQFKKGDKE